MMTVRDLCEQVGLMLARKEISLDDPVVVGMCSPGSTRGGLLPVNDVQVDLKRECVVTTGKWSPMHV